MKSCTGKVLKVDLTAGTSTVEKIPDEVYEAVLSGKGLEAWYLYKHIPAGADPLGPDNILAYACGAGVSSTPHCLMNTCYSLADLDAFDSDMISMEPFMTMSDCFPKMGISPFRRVTYKMAVKEGWAPAPTNDYQKAILEKFGGASAKDPAGRWKSDFGGKKSEGKTEGK